MIRELSAAVLTFSITFGAAQAEDQAPSGKGYLVVSLGRVHEFPYRTIKMTIGRVGEDVTEDVLYSESGMAEEGEISFFFKRLGGEEFPPDYFDQHGEGRVSVLRLEAGTWEIRGFEWTDAVPTSDYPTATAAPPHWNMLSTSGPSPLETQVGWKIVDLHAKFTIENGKAIYIGSIVSSPRPGTNWLGLRQSNGANLLISDQSARDIPIAQKKVPEVGQPEVSIVSDHSGTP